MIKRKPDPNIKPQKNLLIIGATLLALGVLWAIYAINPFGMIRALTEQEKKELKEEQALKQEQERALRAKRR